LRQRLPDLGVPGGREGLAAEQVWDIAEDSRGRDAQWINGRNIFEQSGGVNDPKAWIGDNEIRSHHLGGAMSLYCCGRVAFLSNSIDRTALAALITRSANDH
jgi:hypothetical protein